MSEIRDMFRGATEKDNDERMGVHFIDLEEVLDPSVDRRQKSQEEKNEREELRRRLYQAETRYREKCEVSERLYQHGLDLEADMNELAAKNKFLAGKLIELQQQTANMRKMREEEDEEASQEESRQMMSRAINVMKMEKEKLREKHKDLTAELEQLSLPPKYQEQIPKLKTAEQELKHKLEQVQEVLRSKDEEIEKISTTVIQRSNETKEYFNNIEDLRQEQQQLREQLSRKQEEQILAAQRQGSSARITRKISFFGKLRNLLSTTKESKDKEIKEQKKEERPRKNENWCWCLKVLWKGVQLAAHVAFCYLLAVGIVASMVPICNSPDPDCNLCDIALNLAEYYGELHCTHTL